MALAIDTEEQEDSEGLFEDFDQTLDDEDERRYRPSRKGRQGKPIFLGVIGIAVALGLLTLFFRNRDEGSTENPGDIKGKLDQMEKTITRIEGAQQNTDSLEGQIKALQQSVSKLEGTDRSLRERIEGLNQKVDKVAKSSPPRTVEKLKPMPPVVQKKTPAQVEKVKPVQPLAQQKTPARTETRFHEVEPGESLFQIAKKYGITVDKLRQLNNLKESQPITPGQKLVVK